MSKNVDLSNVKTFTRKVKGVDKEVRQFNEAERVAIIKAVRNKPNDKTVEAVLKEYNISPAMYYSWTKKYNPDVIPDILKEFKDKHEINEYAFESFYNTCKNELDSLVAELYSRWEEKDIITKIASRVNTDNIAEVANVGNISIEELKAFIDRRNINVNYWTVENIKKYLSIE